MKISTQLIQLRDKIVADSPNVVAIEMLKKAGFSADQARTEVAQRAMEKEAANHLMATGIDYDAALSMVKVANVKIGDMKEFKPEPSAEELLVESLTKAASAVEDLEEVVDERDALLEKVAALEAQIAETESMAMPSEPITKLAKSGAFTNADLAALRSLPTDTLTKLASSTEEPWSMGKQAGLSVDSLDPIAQFCMS